MPQNHDPISLPHPGPAGPAWTTQDLADPHARHDKAARVQSMFAAIAPAYDLNNRLHALWLDLLWRRAAVKAAAVQPGDTVLDVACGTGDLTHAFATGSPAQRIIGVDYTQPMLVIAARKRRRLAQADSPRVEYRWADATDLPFDDASFDVVSIAFGIRNVQEPRRALAEFARVLRPGGRLVILEFDTPSFWPVRVLTRLYTAHVMPLTATIISGDRSGAYRYLPRSVERFWTRAEMSAAVAEAGFSRPTVRELTLGVCACYAAVRA